MTRSRTLLVLVVAAMVAMMATPAGAASSNPRVARDAARAKKAKLAAELNTLNASESQVLGAARALDAQVAAQSASVASARQAVAAADVELAAAARSLATTRASIKRLSAIVVQRAVADYMSPRQVDASDFGDTTDLAATARRQALLDSVLANDADVIDQLGAARQDYAIEQKSAQEAKARAGARRAETESRLAALQRNQADQARLAAVIVAHKRSVLGEIDAQSKAEAELSKILARAQPVAGGTSSTARNAGGCIWPAKGPVTSEYGRRWGKLHAGIDIGAPQGTPIWAAKSGTVIFAGQQSGYGNVVIIDHGGGMTTLYGHQSRTAARNDQSVGQGQVIGYVGSTGHSTGNHLHFETRYGGSPRNPRGCLP